MPKRILVRRYEIVTESTNEFKQKLFEQETIEITKIISDVNEIEKSMSLTIPESTILFDRKNGDMYSFPVIINSIKKSMDAK